MDRRMSSDLDNYITGHYGEDQYREDSMVYVCMKCGKGFSDASGRRRHQKYSCRGEGSTAKLGTRPDAMRRVNCVVCSRPLREASVKGHMARKHPQTVPN